MNETALKVLKKIDSNGYRAYLVGGYPRDLYMGKESIDYDICTNATPKDLKNIFGNLILPAEQYGSVTLILNNMRFEITTFRRDIKYINNRKPIEIEYVNNLFEDLNRRDFTMNTMCIDSNGKLIDLLNGREDINRKIVRTVGDANHKISEDSLRILRAIRFATTLNFKLDDNLKQAIINNRDLLKSLSYYRKKDELDKIFSSSNVEYGIEMIKELKLDEPLELSNINSLIPTTYLIGIWAQLDCIDKYSFNSIERDSIKAINELINKDVLDYNNLYQYGLYISTIVAEIKGIDKDLINERYNSLYIKNKTEIKIDVLEICNILNKKPGKYLKDILNDIEYNLVNKQLENTEESIREYISQKYKN